MHESLSAYEPGVAHSGPAEECPVCGPYARGGRPVVHWHGPAWDMAPYGERMEAIEHGMRQVLVTDHELGAFEDFWMDETVRREELGTRAFSALYL